MGKPRVTSTKGRKNNRSDNNIEKVKSIQAGLKRKKQQQNLSNPPEPEDNDPSDHSAGSDPSDLSAGSDPSDQSEEEEEKPTPEDIQRLLEPYTKEQLITLLANSAADDPSLLSHIRSVAEHDIAHRNIFVHRFGYDVTSETLHEVFRHYGPLVDCHVIFDNATGRNKGYGFVVFSTRSGAVKALKQPEKKIGARMALCQLAAIRHDSPASSSTDLAQRRVYVSNVPADASHDKLKAYFATFGEIEIGPSGSDTLTGKWNGFAIFVYKTRDGANRALQEPYKNFEGRQLYCKLVGDLSQKGKLPANPVPPQSLPVVNQQPSLNAVAEAQNAAMLGHNPAYNMLVQNQLLTNTALNPNSFAALNPAALAAFNPTANLVIPPGQGYGAHGYGEQGHGSVGVGLGGYNVFENFRTQESAGLSYRGSQLGQSFSLTPATGFFRGFPQ
ncbi:UBP1-associated protein 2A isoform X4 [Dendrobium catenatum]|uniref:31 kDa ribonucleoprotein, chloroplastic n=2 Tax=Dendrobium catenatum TaxID=906689 RepID=A0A2I0XEF6_9ASPA|nr:UBP1-associated protein 2A isoform X2 [Dendrobium catenatum]XP_028555902.1 UBP1-associated protein 2A isoform X2 [Dendrobium catenatum]XP_028555904.1 UBP1-associated protein 2A isoform X2 [Dendrobium catenatum]XP_028555909.1 UBP1-associated protein 2A isoform X3 [Dendrobium catenatum]XP_028555912.1 UBP1-associated protein 2A isoform X2 [Dendrobium catenatum]XP_028555914.1 UBP1-associated protein 2A isoform X4 [Dendrobium catenatum]PKU86274.1 31 kDa ribonucleoprotein, chloroplastic [Dendrob